MQGRRLQIAEEGASSTAVASSTSRNRRVLPEWFKTKLPTGDSQKLFNKTKEAISELELNTVCQEAKCPNIHECWGRGTATFMIAGQVCTRGCKFCAVGSKKIPPPPDEDEPLNLAMAIKLMKLKHAVITVVNRDDLEDSGAHHYRECILEVNRQCPDVTLELLCSDLAGDIDDLKYLLNDLPLQIFAHNVECVPRLDSLVRDPRASFSQSLKILEEVKNIRSDILTKSSIMVGLGETDDEVVETMMLLRDVDVDILTIGQYLQPNQKLLSVERFPEPHKFEEWRIIAEELGFKGVASGPLVRSSYKSGDMLRKISNHKYQ